MNIILIYKLIILDVFLQTIEYRLIALEYKVLDMVETLYLEMNLLRYCYCCNTFDIDDFYHVVIICPHFADMWKKLALKSIIMQDHLFSTIKR